MKNIRKTLVLFITIFLMANLVACKSKKSKETSEKLEKEVMDMMEEERMEAIVSQFNAMASDKDVELSEVIAFVDDKIKDLDKDNGDRVVFDLEELLVKNLDRIYGGMEEGELKGKIIGLIGDNIFIAEEKLGESKDGELKDFIYGIHENFYKIMLLKGELRVMVDYDKLLKYNENISEKASEYFSIQAKTTNEPILCEGALNISYDELSKGLIKIEKYVRTYPHEERYEVMLRKYKDGLIVYLKGTDKSPVVDLETNKFKKDILASYKETAKNKEDITSYIIRKYSEIILENENTMNDIVRNSILSLVNEAIYHLEDESI